MSISMFEVVNGWDCVMQACETTSGKTIKNVTDEFKRSLLLAEHSPIRQYIIRWKWENIPSWVSVHLVRHKIGIEHFVRSQRKKYERDQEPQGSPVEHECIANAQALINISRKRLCSKAAPETRSAWFDLIEAVKEHDKVLYSVLVPECVYRGFCPEQRPCQHSTSISSMALPYRTGNVDYGF